MDIINAIDLLISYPNIA